SQGEMRMILEVRLLPLANFPKLLVHPFQIRRFHFQNNRRNPVAVFRCREGNGLTKLDLYWGLLGEVILYCRSIPTEAIANRYVQFFLQAFHPKMLRIDPTLHY